MSTPAPIPTDDDIRAAIMRIDANTQWLVNTVAKLLNSLPGFMGNHIRKAMSND